MTRGFDCSTHSNKPAPVFSFAKQNKINAATWQYTIVITSVPVLPAPPGKFHIDLSITAQEMLAELTYLVQTHLTSVP